MAFDAKQKHFLALNQLFCYKLTSLRTYPVVNSTKTWQDFQLECLHCFHYLISFFEQNASANVTGRINITRIFPKGK